MSNPEWSTHGRLVKEVLEGLALAEHKRNEGLLSEEDARGAVWLWIVGKRYAKRHFIPIESVTVECAATAGADGRASAVTIDRVRALAMVVTRPVGDSPSVVLSMEATAPNTQTRPIWKIHPKLDGHRWVWDLSSEWERLKHERIYTP